MLHLNGDIGISVSVAAHHYYPVDTFMMGETGEYLLFYRGQRSKLEPRKKA